MFKGVIFDIDGTLYDYQTSDTLAMKKFCAFVEENLGVDEKTFRENYAAARQIVRGRLKDTAAQHSRVLLIQTALELMGKNSFAHLLEMYDVYWDCFLDNMQPYDGTADFLSELKLSGVKIATCTDMTAHIQYRKLKRLGLDKFIDFMVTSEETGFEKPAPIMFNLALQKLNLPANEVAYFGDAFERDIRGAANVGIKPFWFIDGRIVEGGDEFTKIRSYRDAELTKIFFGDPL